MTEKISNLTLIEGNFSVEDAREILLKIHKSKINFHQRKNWSSQERFGKPDETAEKRIPLLTKNLEEIDAIISRAITENKRIDISSQITIQLV
jgi:hypothetical protein